MPHPKKTTRPTINEQKNERQNAKASAKSKELHPNAKSRHNAAHLLLPLRTRQANRLFINDIKRDILSETFGEVQ